MQFPLYRFWESKFLVKAFFICFAPFLLYGQQDTLLRIRILQDERLMHNDELLSYLKSTNPKIREHSLLAFANIQDTTVIDNIIIHLDDSNARVRMMSAFALGMFGKVMCVKPLSNRLLNEQNETVIKEIYNAIGKCGSANALEDLIATPDYTHLKHSKFIAEACGRFAIRKIKHPNVFQFLASLMTDKEARESAVYALMRYNDSSIVSTYSKMILDFLNDKSPEIRMWSATILGNSPSDTVKRQLVRIAQRDRDWRVRVNAIRALRNSQTEEIKAVLISLIEDHNEHVSLTALTTVEGILNDIEFSLKEIFFKNIVEGKNYYSYRQRGETAVLLGKRLGNSVVGYLKSQLNNDMQMRRYIIKALGETRSDNALDVVSPEISNVNSLISISAIEAYQKIVGGSGSEIQRKFFDNIISLFAIKDPGVSVTVGAAFEDTTFSLALRKSYISKLVSAFVAMNGDYDIEPMEELLYVFSLMQDSISLDAVKSGLKNNNALIREAAAKTYQAITGNAPSDYYYSGIIKRKYFYSLSDLKLLAKYNSADIITSKGSMRITFIKDAAPLTVLNFILLAKKKYYNGLTFHRVVSNFVVQGGDPLGNGSGGPDYSIRTEVHPDAMYSTGAVGMASAGKDTEGSQFFITHSPTPHLDGRYSIFAYTKNLNVVNQIMVGDMIIKVVLH